MFKKGDKVYSILRGWGEVKFQESNVINVIFENGVAEWYHNDGKMIAGDTLIPILYHTEPVITVPKRRVEHTGWIAVDNKIKGNNIRQTSAIIHEDNPDRIATPDRTYQQIIYYTEE